MENLAPLMDKLATDEPTKTYQELAQTTANRGGLNTLASAEAMAGQLPSTEAPPTPGWWDTLSHEACSH